MEWKNGIKMTEEEEEHVRLVKKAGCTCELPLLGYIPGVGPRCRLCGVDVDLREPGLCNGCRTYGLDHPAPNATCNHER